MQLRTWRGEEPPLYVNHTSFFLGALKEKWGLVFLGVCTCVYACSTYLFMCVCVVERD